MVGKQTQNGVGDEQERRKSLSSHFIIGVLTELKVTALRFLNVLFIFPVNLFSKHVSVRFSPPREKSGNLTIWKCAALEEQQLKFPTAFSPRCAHDGCDTVLELCCGW